MPLTRTTDLDPHLQAVIHTHSESLEGENDTVELNNALTGFLQQINTLETANLAVSNDQIPATDQYQYDLLYGYVDNINRAITRSLARGRSQSASGSRARSHSRSHSKPRRTR